MSISMKTQSAILDIALWRSDAQFAIYPQGAREKNAVFAPKEGVPDYLIGGRRYLFKKSKEIYPDQYWGEIVAYRIGCLLGLPVPPAFAALNSATGECGALIEWFYDDGKEVFIMAGDFLELVVQPNYDRQRGSQHNLVDTAKLLRAMVLKQKLPPIWRQWWVNALLFDALIGNTDRHQDNWGFISQRGVEVEIYRFAPYFDNGTSLGHERFIERVRGWTEADVNRYIERGRHHIKWSLEGNLIQGHFGLLEKALAEWPETRPFARDIVHSVSEGNLIDIIQDLLYIPSPVPLTAGRFSFMQRLLLCRLSRLKAVL